MRILDPDTLGVHVHQLHSGNGPGFVVGTRMRPNAHVQLRAMILGTVRAATVQGEVAQPNSDLISLEIRPGVEVSSGADRYSLEAFAPVSGKNVLRTTGAVVTYERGF